MKKKYNPKYIEYSIYKKWKKYGFFKPNNNINKKNYCIIMPPPNITGSLHLGHAFQHTIMDILIRYNRMKGKNTLWQSGLDHAGIATQMIVEKKILSEENKNRKDFNREELINKIWQWKKYASKLIYYQMKRLGNSIDYNKKRFTMDKDFSYSVKKTFIKLYKKNLIYKKKRLVNWDISLKTAISDLEVENKELKGWMWYLKYPLEKNLYTKDKLNYLVIATTRPETILGDVAVAVNPNDNRYKNLIGKKVIIPLINKKIPIISDNYADINKGTGCVKITPAHDFNDYEISQKHNLPMISIFTIDGNIRNIPKMFNSKGILDSNLKYKIPNFLSGLNRFKARNKIIKKLKEINLLEKKIQSNIMVPYGDRSNSIIEPMLSDQWYLKTKSLSKLAIEVVKNNKINFIPNKYKKIYFQWMNNIKDWCISRQLWWGHRIPAWNDIKGNVYVGFNELEIRKKYKINKNVILIQDEDVLDTWFSSGIWSIASLGWPKKSKYFNSFYPTNVIVSGFDIIFFWISRMIMLSIYLNKNNKKKVQIPFKNVFITGLIRDEKGEKMSKTKGNVIDPLDMIDGISLKDLILKRTNYMMKPTLENKIRQQTIKKFPNGIKEYGTDALRFTLTTLACTGKDIKWDMNRLEGYKNFCNKIWNASLFILNILKNQNNFKYSKINKLSLIDKWILIEHNKLIKDFRNEIDNYRFDLAANILYNFIWNKFCNKYLEYSKLILKQNKKKYINNSIYNTFLNVFESLLRLSHPIIPFITEFIWKKIKSYMYITGNNIFLEKYPKYSNKLKNKKILKNFYYIQKIIDSIRKIRKKIQISFKIKIKLIVKNYTKDIYDIINNNINIILCICNIKKIIFLEKNIIEPACILESIKNTDLLVPIKKLINKNIELNRINKEINYINNKISIIKNKFLEKHFIKKINKNFFKKEKYKLKKYIFTKKKLKKYKLIILNL
ncbi:valine--tRNA ligase [Sodalis-like secondary symbiont of Drepanosiphum platanoidis]|uniref:valine--tRNA ligase n=1 Tax=Sodalis-like secondary symbiont of Drepanosiphum platanoidis TaxID=2994493 RepID=UPI0034645558